MLNPLSRFNTRVSNRLDDRNENARAQLRHLRSAIDDTIGKLPIKSHSQFVIVRKELTALKTAYDFQALSNFSFANLVSSWGEEDIRQQVVERLGYIKEMLEYPTNWLSEPYQTATVKQTNAHLVALTVCEEARRHLNLLFSTEERRFQTAKRVQEEKLLATAHQQILQKACPPRADQAVLTEEEALRVDYAEEASDVEEITFASYPSLLWLDHQINTHRLHQQSNITLYRNCDLLLQLFGQENLQEPEYEEDKTNLYQNLTLLAAHIDDVRFFTRMRSCELHHILHLPHDELAVEMQLFFSLHKQWLNNPACIEPTEIFRLPSSLKKAIFPLKYLNLRHVLNLGFTIEQLNLMHQTKPTTLVAIITWCTQHTCRLFTKKELIQLQELDLSPIDITQKLKLISIYAELFPQFYRAANYTIQQLMNKSYEEIYLQLSLYNYVSTMPFLSQLTIQDIFQLPDALKQSLLHIIKNCSTHLLPLNILSLATCKEGFTLAALDSLSVNNRQMLEAVLTNSALLGRRLPPLQQLIESYTPEQVTFAIKHDQSIDRLLKSTSIELKEVLEHALHPRFATMLSEESETVIVLLNKGLTFQQILLIESYTFDSDTERNMMASDPCSLTHDLHTLSFQELQRKYSTKVTFCI